MNVYIQEEDDDYVLIDSNSGHVPSMLLSVDKYVTLCDEGFCEERICQEVFFLLFF